VHLVGSYYKNLFCVTAVREEQVPYDVQNSVMKFHSTRDICQLQAINKPSPE